MLCVVSGPALAAASDLHAVEHAIEAPGDNGHGHLHLHADDHGDRHGHGHDPIETDPDHATGMHGFLHHASSVTVALPDVALNVLQPTASEAVLPEFARLHLPGDSPTHPFRPPIA